MQNRLNQHTAHSHSDERLQRIYQSRLIPAEKKPFLIDLRRSSGPFLAVENGPVICDGASQIASFGLGFNAGALFGTAEYLESWINQTDSETFQSVRRAYVELLQRKLGSCEYVAHFCSSGAEAVESTLAYFFDHRSHPDARRVLAFEGAFHGRMMVALASTWNRSKREPFAWPGYESVFAPYPEMDSDAIQEPAAPAWWAKVWSETGDHEAFELALAACEPIDDSLLQTEIKTLKVTREHLASGKIVAILIEPMQCEGGDRYASARFHQGLAYLCSAYSVPLIYDEIQTGFGLGGEFFWHRMFQLKRIDGRPFYPDGVICAKKAQTGISLILPLTNRPRHSDAELMSHVEQISAASVIRGYIQASVVDQFRDQIEGLEQTSHVRLDLLATRFPNRILRARAKGMSFAFDLETPELISRFVANRFQHGLLYYPAGSKTARFRLNLGYRQDEVELLWDQVESALAATFASDVALPDSSTKHVPISLRETAGYFAFHESFVAEKLRRMRDSASKDRQAVRQFIEDQIRSNAPDESLEVVLLSADNYAEYRSRILKLQSDVYEPARQSTADEFDALFASPNPLSLLLLRDQQIVAAGFAGPMNLFKHQRGVLQDPFLEDPSVAYMLDLTVVESYRGGLGSLMKQAMIMLAQVSGVTALHGRNRDRLAAGMWAINLSLGSYAINYLPDDYPDDEPFRDCIYYRCPTVWDVPRIDLSSAIEMPLGIVHLDDDFICKQMPVAINKMTLSNFVTEGFLIQLEEVAGVFPQPLRHFYTSNGLSESVDKLVKVLWRHRQPRTKLLTIEGCDFGRGSFLARSMSGVGQAFFHVDRLPMPKNADDAEFFDALQSHLATDQTLGMLIEPLLRRTMQKIPEDALAKIIDICRQHQVPVAFNETASLFYRYSASSFSVAATDRLRPDAVVAYLGGQMALVGMSAELFIDEPLLLISTWEGDAFSLAQFHRAMQIVQSDTAAYLETMSSYHNKLTSLLTGATATDHAIDRGIGLITGQLPTSLQGMLRPAEGDSGGGWISCPSYSEQLRFLAAAEQPC